MAGWKMNSTYRKSIDLLHKWLNTHTETIEKTFLKPFFLSVISVAKKTSARDLIEKSSSIS